MGALSALGPAAYGVTRGIQDARREEREEGAFQTDQAIRKSRLASEETERPLRQRALQMGVEDAEHARARRPALEAQQDSLTQLGIDTAKLKKEDLERASKEADEALTKQKRLRKALGDFHMSADPSHVTNALNGLYPDIYGEDGQLSATRNDDGTISVAKGGGGTQVFKGKKWEDGSTMTPDDELGMFAYTQLDPVKAFEKKWEHAKKMGVETERTGRALGVASTRADAVGARAGERKSEAWYNRQHGQIKSTLDSILKTTGTAGSFVAGYAHENDAALRGLIEQGVESEIESGTPVRQAANKVVNEARQAYDLADKKARQHSAALSKAGIKPNDRKAVEAAAQGGNPDAKELLRTFATAEKLMGPSLAKYLESNLPAK